MSALVQRDRFQNLAKVSDCLLRWGGRLQAARITSPPCAVPAATARGQELTARAGLTSAQTTRVYLFGVKPPPSVRQWLPSQVNSRELIMITFDFPKTFPWQGLHPSYWYLSEVEGRIGKAKSLLPTQVHSLRRWLSGSPGACRQSVVQKDWRVLNSLARVSKAFGGLHYICVSAQFRATDIYCWVQGSTLKSRKNNCLKLIYQM